MIYLTYQNWACKDGLGAQIQRIISIYQTARFHGIGYIHTPILGIENQGVAALEDSSYDSKAMVTKANHFFWLMSDKCSHFDVKEDKDVFRKDFLDKKDGKTYLYSIRFGHYTNENPHILSVPIPFHWLKKEISSTLYIGCHIRRGDVTVQETMRLLPNSYYLNCLKFLTLLFDFLNCKYEVHIFTESATKEITVDSSHPVFKASLRGSAVIKPADDLDEFRAIQNATVHINGCAVDSIVALANADILLGSKSSFSYVAGLMNQKGVKIFHPFWCALPKDWIHASNSEELAKSTDLLQNKLMKSALDISLFRKQLFSASGLEGILGHLFGIIGTTNKRFVTLGRSDPSYTRYLQLLDFTGILKEDNCEFEPENCDVLFIHSRRNYQLLENVQDYPRVIVTNFNTMIPSGFDRILLNFDEKTLPECNSSSLTGIKNFLNRKGYSLITVCENECIFVRDDAAKIFTWKNYNDEHELFEYRKTEDIDPKKFEPPYFLPSTFV